MLMEYRSTYLSIFKKDENKVKEKCRMLSVNLLRSKNHETPHAVMTLGC